MTRVAVHVYDLSKGVARAMSMSIVGKQVDIIPHTGVVCFGQEYFFGGGICVAPVGQGSASQAPLCEVIELGETTKTAAELQAWLTAASPRFTTNTYDLLKWNCNHFSNELVQFLSNGAASVPARIVNVADEALSNAPALRQMLEGMQNQFNQANVGNQLNPLGHVAGASAAPQAVPPPSVVPAAPPAATASGGGGEQLDLETLRAALVAVDAADVEARRACLTTAAKLGSNIVDHPNDAKFRKIRSANGAFAKKVVACAGGPALRPKDRGEREIRTP